MQAKKGAGDREKERGAPGPHEIDAHNGAACDARAGGKPDGEFVIGEVMKKQRADHDVEARVGKWKRTGIGGDFRVGRARKVARQAIKRNGANTKAALEGTGRPAIARRDIEYRFKRHYPGQFGVQNTFAAEPRIDEFEFCKDGMGQFVGCLIE